MHKQKGKYFSAGGMGQCTSKGGSTSQQEGWGSRNFSFGNYTGKQELGGIRVHLVVRTSSADLGLEQSVVVLRSVSQWPAFDPLFFSWGRGPIQRSGQLCCLDTPNSNPASYQTTNLLEKESELYQIPPFFKIFYLFIICKYTVVVFRHSRRGHQILLRMVVSHPPCG